MWPSPCTYINVSPACTLCTIHAFSAPALHAPAGPTRCCRQPPVESDALPSASCPRPRGGGGCVRDVAAIRLSWCCCCSSVSVGSRMPVCMSVSRVCRGWRCSFSVLCWSGSLGARPVCLRAPMPLHISKLVLPESVICSPGCLSVGRSALHTDLSPVNT
jgi:hypothetical protein